MLNSTGFTVEKAVNVNQILIDPNLAFSMSCVVNDTAATAVNGKKIMKAGTPITGSLDARTTAFTPASTTSGVSNAVGLLLHDVDITNGANNGAVLLFGQVNTNRMDATVKALITAEVKKALPLIIAVAC